MQPSSSRVARKYLVALDVGFSLDSIEKLRKDFLLLLKNVDRVASYEDLVRLRTAVGVWDEHYEDVIQGLLRGLSNTIWTVLTGEPKFNQYFEDQHKEWYDYWEKKIRTGYWPLHIEMVSLPYESLESWLYKWSGERSVDSGKADIFSRWTRDKKKWSEKVKREARKTWTALDEYVTWVSQRREGAQPVRDVKEVYRQDVGAFNVTFVGLEDQDYYKAAVEKLKLGLKHYEERARKVFPLLLGSAKLPFEFRADQGLDCGGRYEGRYIVLCPVGAPFKEYAHIIAHEMGHHVFKMYLSDADRKFWDHAIRQDYMEADLREILAAWREGEWVSDVYERLSTSDPVLALQIDGLGRHHRWANRGDAERYLRDYGPKVHVPKHPITGYATKNPEEAFCETVGRLVAYGPQAVDPLILHWLKTILPREVKISRVKRDGGLCQ